MKSIKKFAIGFVMLALATAAAAGFIGYIMHYWMGEDYPWKRFSPHTQLTSEPQYVYIALSPPEHHKLVGKIRLNGMYVSGFECWNEDGTPCLVFHRLRSGHAYEQRPDGRVLDITG